MSQTPTDECGSKHLRLVGLITGLVLLVCGATVAHTMATATAAETRIRAVELQASEGKVRFEAIRESLRRIENRLDAEKR